MNRDELQGKWKVFKGQVKEKWGKLTDDDIAQTQGNKEELAGKIQQKYGGSKEDIRKQLDQMAA